jgi:hypothetical protein
VTGPAAGGREPVTTGGTIALVNLRPLAAASDDPGYAARLAGALSAAGRPREAGQWRARAAARYDELALRHPDAFAGHAADFRRQAGQLHPAAD